MNGVITRLMEELRQMTLRAVLAEQELQQAQDAAGAPGAAQGAAGE